LWAVTRQLVTVITALVLTAVLGAGFGNVFMYAPLPFRVSMLSAVIWIVLAILGAMLATEAAATRASRITVRKALAHI
jgi:putative ABC transport system permease protein